MASFILILMVQGQAAAQARTFTPDMVRAAQQDPRRFTLDERSVEITHLGPVIEPKIELPKPPSTPPKDPSVDLGTILNLAMKIWKIIEANKPVVDVATSYANALPRGIEHWGQLAGWKPPVATLYGFRAKNLYGSTVIEVRYQVMRHWGGSYKGKGAFLNGVSVEPLRVDAAWGYTFKMDANAVSVGNVGSSEDPIASMLLKLGWSIDTVLKHSQGTSIYHLQGDGKFREMGGPFRKPAQARVARFLKRSGLTLP